MWLSDWRLCARSVEDPTVLLVSIDSPDFPRSQTWLNATPASLPVQLTPTRVHPAHEHFPYGEDVFGN